MSNTKDPAPQVPAMVTSGASGQNLEADKSVSHSGKSDALCDEGLAGGRNPASAGPADTPRTNAFFASCEKVTGWNHVYSKQAAFCRKLERELAQHQQVAAAAYQLAGLVGAPVRFLDALGDAANGEIGRRTDPEKLLPVDLSECEECVASKP